MIKNRSKSFAPKKAVSRVPSRAPSSARPSVERQSQTPAPSQPTRETVPSIIEDVEVLDTVPSTSQNVETPSQPEPRQQSQELSASVIDSLKIVPSPSTLKRKTRDNEEHEPPAKRIPAESAEEQNRNLPPIESVRHRALTETAPVPTETIISSQTIANDAPNISFLPAGGLATPNATISTGRPLFDQPHTITSRLPPNVAAIQATPIPNIEVTVPSESEQQGEIRSTTLQRPIQQPHLPPTPAATQLAQEILLASVETNNGNGSRIPTPERAVTPEAPIFRYPSPQNLVRISDIPIAPRSGDFGPAGGSDMFGPAGSGGSGLGAAGAIGGPIRIGAVLRNSDIVPRATLNPDGTSGVVDDSASGTDKGKKKKKKYTKRKRILKDGDNVRATIDMQVAKTRRKPGTGKRVSKRKEKEEKRKARDPTPEGASDEEIDPAALTMTDLCKDLRIGKKFSMHDEIKQRVVARKKTIQAGNMIRDHSEIPDIERLVNGGLSISQAGSGEAGPSSTNRDEISPPPDPSNRGLQLIMVDNQIVLDTNSTSLNRHQRAAQNEQATEAVEENDFTRIITSGTYMKRERAQFWDYPATDLFYKGLRMFGTDFEMIAKLFPHRNRRQIKLKFGREEACNMDRINRALLGQKEPIDLEQFTKFSNIKLESVEEIEEEQRKIEEEQNAELTRIEAEAAEETRKKKEEIMGRSGAGGNVAARVLASSEFDDPVAEGSGASGRGTSVGRGKKGAKGKQKKSKNSSYGLGGEVAEIVQVIDY